MNETVGAFPAPPGVLPNFENPESIAYRVIIAAVLGPAIALPIFGVRLYTRHRILRNLGYDDYTIILATILALAFSIYVGWQTTNGLGKHIWDVPPSSFYQLMKIGDIVGPICYNLSTMFIKVSLCIFYMRLKPFPNFQIACYVVMVVSIIYSLLAAFGFLWVCQPIAKYWDFTIMTGKCINLTAFFLATACINAATDLALLVLPFSILKDLQLPLRRKIGVGLLLTTGSFVCIVSIVRMKIVIDGMYSVPLDGTWGMVANFIWILAEMWLGIICACLPAVHSFYVRTFKKKKGDENPDLHNRDLQVVQDPNSGRVDLDDSGYQSVDVDLETIGQEDHMYSSSTIRAMASDKSLLASTKKCNDES